MKTNIMAFTSDSVEKAEESILDYETQIKISKSKALTTERLASQVGKLLVRMDLAEHRVAKANNAKAVNAACAAGLRIEATKAQINHGEYGVWLKSCGPGISEDTAERYRKLAAKSADVRILPLGTTLNQAFRILDIIKAPAELDPTQQLRRDLLKIEPNLKAFSCEGSIPERIRLAKKIRMHMSKCDMAAQKLEASVPFVAHCRDENEQLAKRMRGFDGPRSAANDEFTSAQGNTFLQKSRDQRGSHTRVPNGAWYVRSLNR